VGRKGEVEGCAAAGATRNLSRTAGSHVLLPAYHNKDAAYSCLGCHLKNNIVRKEKGQKPLPVAPCANNGCHVAQK
jgi:hypothetical protein